MTDNLFNWREMPFVRLFIPFALGIMGAEFWQTNSIFFINIIILLSIFCIIFFVFKKVEFRWRWLFGIPLSLFLFLLGFQSVFYQNDTHRSNHFKNILNNEQEKIIVGIVTDHVEKPTNFRLTLKVHKMGNAADSLHDVSGNLLLYLKKDSSSKSPPQYGDLVLIQGRVNEVEPPKNPDVFDFKNYLHHQNIHYQSFIQEDVIKILAQNRGNFILHIITDWQNKLIAILNKHLPTEREFAVGSALILGYRDALTDEVRDAYIQTGSMHILAVSGMHLVLIFKMLDNILNLYKTGNRRWRKIKSIISIILICIFTLLTGAGASIMRAAVMSIFASIGKGWGKSVNPYNLMAGSAFTLLLWNPFWLFDVGFQLSYCAVLGIMYFQPKIYALCFFKNKISNWAWEATSVGLAAQLVVTPISIYYFHQFPTYFWLSGLLAVGVSSCALVTGILLFPASLIPTLGYIVGKILFGFLWLMNEIVFFIQKLPLSILSDLWLSTLNVFIIYFILIFLAISLKTRLMRDLIYPLSMTTILSLSHTVSELKISEQREIVIYHIPRNSVVDYVNKKKCYSFLKKSSSEKNTQNKIKFVTQNHRIRLKINSLKKCDFNEYEKNDNLIYHSGVSEFYDHRLVILDKLPIKSVFLRVNTILIRQNAKFSMAELQKYFHFDTVIIDGSNTALYVEAWKKECHVLGINYHDTAEKGAWTKQL